MGKESILCRFCGGAVLLVKERSVFVIKCQQCNAVTWDWKMNWQIEVDKVLANIEQVSAEVQSSESA